MKKQYYRIISAILITFTYLTFFQISNAALGSNTIYNPSVETVSTSTPSLPAGWLKGGSGANTRSLTYPVTGVEGVKAVRTEITSYSSGDAKWYFNYVPATSGQTYTFSDYYTSNTISYVTMQFQLQNGTYKYLDIAVNLPSSSTWAQVNRTFTVPTYSSPVVAMTAFHLIKSVGWISTDNYSLQLQIPDDLTPPTVSVNTIQNQPTSGNIDISANANDNVAVSSVKFLIDDIFIGQDITSSPYVYNLDTTQYADGLHNIKAVAKDTSSNFSTSSPVFFTILNNQESQTGLIVITTNVINDNNGNLSASNFTTHIYSDSQEASTSPVVGNQSGISLALSSGVYNIIQDSVNGYQNPIFNGDCDSNGNVTIVSGQTSYCVITNDDNPPVPSLLNISTNIINDNNGTSTPTSFSFNLKKSNVDVPNSPFSGEIGGNQFSLVPGLYTLSFNQLVGYTFAGFSGDCDSNGNINVVEGQNYNCIATFNDIIPPPPPGFITVNLVIINDSGGNKNTSDFPLFVNASNVSNSETNGFDPGTYTISEITDPSYTVTISGDCDSNGVVSLQSNQNKNCTITNDDISPVPPPPPNNTIYNPSVETVSTSTPSLPAGWLKGGSGANTRSLTYPVTGVEGVKAVRTEITSYSSGDAKWYFNYVPATSGQTYTFSDYYTSNTISYVTMQFQLQNGTYKYLDIAVNLPSSSTWAQVNRTFTVPTYSSPVVAMTAFHLIKSVGWISTDNYSLSTYVAPPIDENNIIINASVESPSSASPSIPASWTKATSAGSVANYYYPVPGYNSLSAVQVDVTSYSSGAGAKWYFQSVPVLPGEEYVFSDYFKSNTDSFVTVQFQLNDGSYRYLDLMRLTPSIGWKEATDTFMVPDNVVSLTVIHLIQSVGTLTTDNFSLKRLPSGKFNEGMISLNFDDGELSVYENAIPLLNAAGIKSGQYIVPGFFGETEVYVNESQTQEMASQGHEIGSHTRTHAHLTKINSSQLISEVFGSKSDLANLGLNPDIFVYPYGEYNDGVEQVVRSAGYKGARSVRVGYNTKNTNPFELQDQHVESNVTIEQIKGWIDKAIINKTWLILELHSIDHTGNQYSTTPEILQQIIDYIKLTNIKVVTNSEGVTLMGY